MWPRLVALRSKGFLYLDQQLSLMENSSTYLQFPQFAVSTAKSRLAPPVALLFDKWATTRMHNLIYVEENGLKGLV